MNRLKRKAVLAAVFELVSLLLLGTYLTLLQNQLAVDRQETDTRQKMTQITDLVAVSEETARQLEETFDAIYQSKASSLAYMVQQELDPELTGAVMEDYRTILNVDNVLLLDRSGNILCQAQPTQVDFIRSRYNQLRTVFETGQPSEAFQVDMGGSGRYRYYGALIDADTMAVVVQDPAELEQIKDETASWKSMLENVSVGLHGYCFAVSAKDYSILYHPNEDLIGQDALNNGLDISDLRDGKCDWMTVDGQECYCGVVHVDDVYILSCVSRDEIFSANAITVIIVLFVFFAAITTVVVYAILLLQQERREGAAPEDHKLFRHLCFHRPIGRKLITVSVMGLLCVLVSSYYMQTLFSLSNASLSNAQSLVEVDSTIQRYEENIDLLTARYDSSYISKAETAAYILDRKPELLDRDALSSMTRALGVEYIMVFDTEGNAIATDSPYSRFSLSTDPEDQSYEFRQLLQGVPYLVQEAQTDDVGSFRQYVGVTLRDEEGEANGFVQISVLPDLLQRAVDQMGLSTILQSVRTGSGGFAFAVDPESKNFLYYPEERYIGRSALEYGMEESALRDGDSGYITLGQQKYFATCRLADGVYIYVARPADQLGNDRVLISLSTAGVSLVFLALVWLMLTFERRKGAIDAPVVTEDTGKKKRARMMDVVMPDGSVKRTESAFSRWSNQFLGWSEMTCEQKVMMVLKVLMGLLALFIVVAVANKDAAFSSTSVFRYVLDGSWKRGVNVFAFTACIMILCVVSVASMLLRGGFKLLSHSLSARGETVVRLINNMVKYASVLVALYFCFSMLGVDTATLLASAGILSLVIGLGAQDLVKDILAGLFIIFEGEYRVGDIVTIGDWRGTVLEIGVRTTKIEAPGGDIKIINNSGVSNVINMTRKDSFAVCDVGIEYGESLERVESILATELPNIRRHLPKISDGPFYKGVAELGDSGVIIRIVAKCAEGDRLQMARDLNREMKLIFDRYKINVPFPQVVVNHPVEFLEATEWQRRRAEEFAEAQREEGKNMEVTNT